MVSNQEKQLRVISKKLENYRKLNDRIKEDYQDPKLLKQADTHCRHHSSSSEEKEFV